jgi:hypothetical protein
MKNKFWILGIIGVIILISVVRTLFSYPETNKNEKYSEVQNTFYQNTAYNFSVNFPDGWKISSRDSNDSQAIVQKATKGSGTISLAVRDVPLVVEALSPEENTIKDIVEFEKFKQQTKTDMEKALPGVRNFEFKEMFIDQIPAYWVKFSGPSSIGNSVSEDTVEQYQFFYKNVLYMISTTANSNDFASMKDDFNVVINSFKINR